MHPGSNMPRPPETALLYGVVILALVGPAESQGICDETIVLDYSDHTNYVTSPAYPFDYPPFMACSYSILADPGSRIRITFDFFDIERSNNAGVCTYDYLQIYDGYSSESRRVGTWCGQVAPPTMLSTNSDLYIEFISDGSIQECGFSALLGMVDNYHVDPLSPTPIINYICHEELNGHSGVFQSPGFPGQYDNYVDCVYVINADNYYATVQIRFLSFDLEPSYGCVYDYVEVRDGPSPGSAVLGRYCGGSGNTPPDIIESIAGGSLYVIFHTDYSERFTGFRADYIDASVGFPSIGADGDSHGTQFVCDGTIVTTAKAGLLVSHETALSSPYPVNRQCNVTIYGDRPDERIFINVVDSDLSPQLAGQCGPDGDFLRMSTTPVTWLCGRDRGHFSTDENSVTITFNSDSLGNPQQTGFKLVYSVYYEDSFGCNAGYFMCANGRCIIDEVVCDGFNHCGDESDEWEESCEKSRSFWWITVVIFLVASSPCICLLALMANVSKAKNRSSRGNDTAVILSDIDARRPTPPPPYSAPVSPPPTQATHQGPPTISQATMAPRRAVPPQGPSTISSNIVPPVPPNLYSQASNPTAQPPAVATPDPTNCIVLGLDGRQRGKTTLPPL